MNGIEKITGRIEADVQQEIDGLLGAARDKAAAIRADYESKAASESEAILKKGELAAEQREERLGSVSQLESRKMTLALKQEMVENAFEKALSGLTGLPDEKYIALLAKLAVSASRTGREAVIFSQKDRARFGKQAVTAANDLLSKAGKAGELTLAEETRPMAGGLILRDRKVETNCSFEVLIHLQREAMAAEVAGVLFG